MGLSNFTNKGDTKPANGGTGIPAGLAALFPGAQIIGIPPGGGGGLGISVDAKGAFSVGPLPEDDDDDA